MRQAKSHKPRLNFPTRTVLTDAPSTQRLRASTYFRWCGGRKVKRFVAATVRECSPRPRGTHPLARVAPTRSLGWHPPTRSSGTHPLARVAPTHSLGWHLPTCSKGTDILAREVSTHLLERYRHACSRGVDTLARKMPTAVLETCRYRCSKSVDSSAREVPTYLLERYRHTCSRDTDTLARKVPTHRPERAYLIRSEGLIPRYSASWVFIVCRSHCCTLLQTSIKYSHIQTKLGT